MKALGLSLVLILINFCQVTASEGSLLTTEQWLEDLEFVVSTLKSRHPNLYYKTSEMELDSLVEKSRDEISEAKSDIECYFAIRKVTAAIEDGHTQLLDEGIFNLLDLRFPIRVDEFTDGVYITIISKEHEVFLGSRVIAINGKPIENILASLEKAANNDNKFGRKYWALNGISFARVLYGLKVINNTDYIEIELITRNEESRQLTLQSILDSSDIEYGWSNWLNVGPTKGEYVTPSSILGEKNPLYSKNQ